MLSALALGLGTALCWGTADFFARQLAVRFGFVRTLFAMSVASAAVLVTAGALRLIDLNPGEFLVPLLALGLLNTLGGLVLYYAFQHGPLSVVSPIASAFPVVTGLLAIGAGHEHVLTLTLLCAGAVVLGTVLVATPGNSSTPPDPHRRRAVLGALASALVFGLMCYLLGRYASRIPAAAPIAVFRIVGVLVLLVPVWLLPKRTASGNGLLPGAAADRKPRALLGLLRSPLAWAVGVLDSGGYICYALGTRSGPITVVAAVAGLFSAWTVVLSLVFLRERLRGWQVAGLALIFAALLIFGLRS